jgi:uncharacterized repeat protein (TIGR02059 family)
MKKQNILKLKLRLISIFLLASSTLLGTTYYVSPTGSDAASGTLSAPWKTWGKAFTSTTAGDIVYFRGGVYPHTVTDGNGYTTVKGGSAGKITVYMAYPGEVPILDCSNVKPTVAVVKAINASLNYIKFKGLVIRNLLQPNINHEIVAIRSTSISNTTFENCTVYNIGGVGFQPWNPVNVHYINCDTYNCNDPYGNLSGGVPGGRGTGFAMITQVNQNSTVYYKGCRAWKCGDQGFSMLSIGYVEADGCWSFSNGLLQGGGHGFKESFNLTTSLPLNRKIINCIAAYNKYAGFTTNDNKYQAIPMMHANNVAYRNAHGFFIYNTASSDALERSREYYNNISYANTTSQLQAGTGALYTHTHNSWNGGVSVTNADFVSVDSTGLAGPRQPDGSLPDLNFLKLATGTDLIDAGKNVGLPYIGSAPDLGAYEKASESVVIPVYVSSSIANATPSVLEMTHDQTLANVVPAASAFSVMVNSVARTVSSVSISGTKVLLTLSSPVAYGNVVTVAYTKPTTNPLQSTSGGQAASITAKTVTNNVAAAIPVYVSSVIANATPSVLEMTYDQTLANIAPSASAFSVMVNSVARTVSSVSISGTKVLLTLSSPVAYGNVVTVAYTKPTTNPLQSTSGGQAASITAKTVTNNVAAAIPVYVSSVIANATPSVLEMTYNLTLANIAPSASAFSVMVNSVARTVSSVSISGTKVLLTLSSPVAYGNVVTVAYTKPTTNPLQSTSGGQAASITAKTVTNNVAAAIPVYVSSVIANATPSVLEIAYDLTLANIAPSASAFSVMVNSVARTVSSVSISGTKVLLTLSVPVAYGNVVTVAYTKPTTNPLQSTSGGQAASITARSVTNNVVAVAATGNRYYVARNGSDSNNGAIGTPWATWGKAFASTTAGDTVFFRGGVYPHTVTNGNGYTTVRGGSAGKITVYMAYPGEVPILDCSNVNPTVTTVRAINASLNYIKFKGLVIRNLRQPSINHEVVAVMSTAISNTTFENCKVYNIGGVAFQPWNPVNVHFLNCDAYNCIDPYGHSGSAPGKKGTGFSMITKDNQSSTVYFKNCRAWKCSDKGFAMQSVGYVEADGCWAFNNGHLQGGGDGFKVSFTITTSVPLARKITRCIAVYNKYSGFTTNDNQAMAIPMILANNVAYRNNYGFFIYNTATSDALERGRKFHNNISYANSSLPVFVGINALYTHSHNSWDHSPAVSVNNVDFVSVDSTGLSGPRQADGSLPDLNFLKLATGSDLIDAGINVGLPYVGSAPDLGAFEKASGSSKSTKGAPVISFIEPYDGEHFVASEKIDVTLDSYDPDTLISKVEYLIGDTKIGESLQAPYSISFESPVSGAYRLTSNAFDKSNKIIYSSSVDVYIDTDHEPVKLYPNPNDGRFSIESLIPLQNRGDIVNVINSTGQIVYQGTWDEESTRHFDLSHLDTGLYILIIKSQGILFTKKFIKN